MKKTFASAIFITFVSIGVTWAIMWLFAQKAYGFVPAEVLFKSAMVCILIAFPTGLLLETQKRQLADTSSRLRKSQKMLQDALDDMKRSAELDCLTSLLNRGSFLNKLEHLQNAGMEGAMLMIDADDFKSINDKYGHAAGDRALIMIADTIATTVRHNDLVGRLGGEEFAVFLLGTDRRNAMIVAENIRRAVNELEFWPVEFRQHKLSVSIGGDHLTRFNTLVEAFAGSDACMYEAKNRGKNQCVFAQDRHDTARPATVADRNAA